MRLGSWALVALVIISAIVIAGAAVFAYVNVRQFVAESPIALPTLPALSDLGQQPTATSALPSATASPTTPPTQTATLVSATVSASATGTSNTSANVPSPATAISPSAVPATATPDLALLVPTRVTALIMGIDARHGEKGPFRTDTMIVISIDPIRKTAAILSVPRDIYLQIPGYGVDRINTAEGTGEVNDYPGGGPMLAVKTVENLLGIPIQHYFLLNFDVFDTVINAVGPIQVCPDQAIHDTNYPDGSYGIITVDFPAGCQMLDATKLLEYSRVRHNAGDDFGRAARQQEVIRAVREKVLTLGGISALIGQAGPVWDSIKNDVQTDMAFDQMVTLAQVALTIPKDNISSVVLTDKGGYLIPSTTPDGQQVLSPIYEKIHALVGQMFAAPPGNPITDQILQNGTPTPTLTSAVIQVSNGAGVSGLAAQFVTRLRGMGFHVLDPQNADLPGGYAKSVIRVFTGNFDAARQVAQTLGIDPSAITPAANGPQGVDLELVLGADVAPTATPS